MIKIIKDVDLIDKVEEYDVVLVGANIYGSMYGGFQHDVKIRYNYVHQDNINTRYGDLTRIGTVLESARDGKPTFCLCYILDHVSTRSDGKKENLNYEGLEKCLKLINILYKGKKIGTTLLGTSPFDGYGDKEKVIKIFEKTLIDVVVDVYDYEQLTRTAKFFKSYTKGLPLKEKNKEEWLKYVEECKKKLTIQYNENNIKSN